MTPRPPTPVAPGVGRWTLAVLLLLHCLRALADTATNTPPVVPAYLVVVGAPGEPAYATNFVRQADAWTALARRTGAEARVIGTADGATNDLERLRLALEAEPREGPSPLVLVLVGHGSFDGREARFNLRGPDLTATNLQQWLAPVRRPVVVVDTASCSAPFLTALSRTNRIVLSATRSANEHNATRLGGFMADALSDPGADLDRDGELSLLEAFLAAAARVAESYKAEGRLATEHALLDDNGDGLGTPADWFRGTRATKKARGSGAVDGLRAHQFALVPGPDTLRLDPARRARRDELELAVARLRDSRPAEPTPEYDAKLEALLLELARLVQP